MRIAIDIDGCMTDDNRFRLEQYGKYLFEHDLPPMDMPYNAERKCSYMTREEFGQFWDATFHEYIENVQPLNYVSEVTNRLHNDGHTLIIATGRHDTRRQDEVGEKVRNITVNWLKKHDIYFDDILYCGFPKVDYIRDYHCDLFIEDIPRTVEMLAREMPVLMFDNPYNRDFECENVTRVFSWYDIYRHIRENDF